jgi:hypothetical protein
VIYNGFTNAHFSTFKQYLSPGTGIEQQINNRAIRLKPMFPKKQR